MLVSVSACGWACTCRQRCSRQRRALSFSERGFAGQKRLTPRVREAACGGNFALSADSV